MKVSIDIKEAKQVVTKGIIYTFITIVITAFLVLMYALLTV
ncbi:MAG: hypothetical protein ACUZ77_03735 [Candidatus Brocadiales bacterium]